MHGQQTLKHVTMNMLKKRNAEGARNGNDISKKRQPTHTKQYIVLATIAYMIY